MTISPAHGMLNVSSPTGINGSMPMTNNASTNFLKKPEDRPTVSVKRINPIPVIVGINASPMSRKTVVISSPMNDG